MPCNRLTELMKCQLPHYQKQLDARKEYFDRLTRYDVWDYLVERDFQKRFFDKWAEAEKRQFCMRCDANGSCGIKRD